MNEFEPPPPLWAKILITGGSIAVILFVVVYMIYAKLT